MTLMNHELTFIQNELKKELDEPRYQHRLGVMYTASAMPQCVCCRSLTGTDSRTFT